MSCHADADNMQKYYSMYTVKIYLPGAPVRRAGGDVPLHAQRRDVTRRESSQRRAALAVLRVEV